MSTPGPASADKETRTDCRRRRGPLANAASVWTDRAIAFKLCVVFAIAIVMFAYGVLRGVAKYQEDVLAAQRFSTMLNLFTMGCRNIDKALSDMAEADAMLARGDMDAIAGMGAKIQATGFIMKTFEVFKSQSSEEAVIYVLRDMASAPTPLTPEGLKERTFLSVIGSDRELSDYRLLPAKTVVQDGCPPVMWASENESSWLTGESALSYVFWTDIPNTPFTVYMSTSNSTLTEARRGIVRVIGTTLLVCLAVTMALAMLFARSIAARVRHLKGAIMSFAAGDYSKRVRVENRDEFGDISAAVNLLGGQLEDLDLFSKAKRMKDDLDKELAAAGEAQKKLLPGKVECPEGLTVSFDLDYKEAMGGDFYAVVDTPEDTTYVLADVQGKSATGALPMAMAMTCIRNGKFQNSAQMLKFLNDFIAKASDRFIAVSVLIYDKNLRKCSIFTAGGVPFAVMSEPHGEVEVGSLEFMESTGVKALGRNPLDMQADAYAAAARPLPDCRWCAITGSDGMADLFGGLDGWKLEVGRLKSESYSRGTLIRKEMPERDEVDAAYVVPVMSAICEHPVQPQSDDITVMYARWDGGQNG